METVSELFATGLTMFGMSYFIALFDGKTARMLRLVAYLNGIAIAIIIGASIAAFGTHALQVLDGLSKWKPF